jgi:radical SAM protein with 4Fe4S-binding SPASM domain
MEPKSMQMSAEDALREPLGISPWTPPENLAVSTEHRLASAPCKVCATSVAIMPNGEVRPCTDTIVPLGNLTRTKFREIYRNNSAVDAIRDLRWRDVHGCRDCDLVLACHRCHASALHEAGDYLGPYATACSFARARYAAAVGGATVLAPEDGVQSSRDPMLGPYRIVAPAQLRPIAHRTTDADEQRVRAMPWLRADKDYMRSLLGGEHGTGIVLLRRSRGGAPVASSTQNGPAPGCVGP